ncbi:MAG: CBS domain-containing protein [Armatimonadota bacterium]
MRNSDRFLNAFRAIEEHLRKLTGKPKIPFWMLVNERAKAGDLTIWEYRNDLTQFAELRNAIVHMDGGKERVIAEPNDYAVGKIERIRDLILQPPGIGEIYHRPVQTCKPHDSIMEVARAMANWGYSQMPVVEDGQFHGLITTHTIARWLGVSSHQTIESLREARVSEALLFAKNSDNYRFIGKHKSVYDIIEVFENYGRVGRVLDAILVTEEGKPGEEIIGIITTADLPKAYELIRLEEPSENS